MDYIFASGVRTFTLLLLIVSYDIVCQWFINLFLRMQRWPPELRLSIPSDGALTAVIPKFHFAPHESKGHAQYNLHWRHGAAQSDCEGCERIWAAHNPLGSSTKKLGPGSRHDTLNYHFGFWNWLKVSGMGERHELSTTV